MQQVIIAIHLMVVSALVVLVLYQKSEGGALGMGQSGFLTGRGQANALTRATGILATIFFLTSIALTVLPAWERRAAGGDDWTTAIDQGKMEFKELKKEAAPAAPATPGEAKDSIFEQLQRAQEKRQGLTPAAPKVEAPKAETPKAEAPKAEGPKAEAPKSAAPAPAAEPEKPALRPSAEEPAAAPQPGAPDAAKPDAAKPVAPEVKSPEVKSPEKTPEPAPAAPPPTQWKSPTQ